nr:retrovirus-related Pol polyprotein from transposon TNT 1-94 [Tanacetum cinerariifolium]
MNSKLNVNADLKCATCNGCLFFDNHDACVLAYINSMNASLKSKSVMKPVNRKFWQPTGKMFTTVGHIWKPTGRTFTLIGNVCPLTRIATTAIVPLREPIPIESNKDKPVVTLVYSRKSKAAKKKVPVSNSKINKSLLANKTEPKNSWGSTSSNVPSSLIECRLSKLFYGVNLLSSISGSQPQGNTKNDRIQRAPSKVKMNKLEDHHRTVIPSLNKKKSVVDTKAISTVTNSKLNVNANIKCATYNGCLFSDNHDSCVLAIATTAIVPLREPIPIVSNTDKTVVTLVYLRKSKAAKKNVLVSNLKINKSLVVQIVLWYLDSGCSKHMTGDRSQLINFAMETACYTQNRSIIRLPHGKTPYELLHNKLPDLSFLYVFGDLCYSNNNSKNLGKLQPKADIGIFISYAPTKKAFRIYNRRTRRIVETIHVDFDELTTMASEQSSLGPALNEMTLATITDSTGSPFSTTVDQDASSASKSHTTAKTQFSIISQDVEEDNIDIEVAHMGNDPLFGVPIPEVTSAHSSSTIAPQTIVQP